MANSGNWILESSLTIGSGQLTTIGAADGFGTFQGAVPSGDVWYSLEDSNGNREAGVGAFNGDNIIQRTTVMATLVNGVYNDVNPTAINLSGESLVGCAYNNAAFESMMSDLANQGAAITINSDNISNNSAAISINAGNISSHTGNTDNPHAVQAVQVPYDPTDDPTSSEINLQDAVVNHGASIEERVTTLSGITEGGLITGSGNTFSVAAGSGAITDTYTDTTNSSVDRLSWATQNNITLMTGSLSVNGTHIFISETGTVFQVPGAATMDTYRNHIFLGKILFNSGNITEIINSPSVVKQTATDAYDALTNTISLNGADLRQSLTGLSLWVTGGNVFYPGVNWHVDRMNPNVREFPAAGSDVAPAVVTPMDRNGNLQTPSAILPSVWDDNGVLTPLSGSNACIHRLYSFGLAADRGIILLYGQVEYVNAGTSRASLATDNDETIVPIELANAYFLGYASFNGGENDWVDPNKSWIVSEGGSAGGSTATPVSASGTSLAPAGNIQSLNVQDGMEELDTEKAGKTLNETVTALWGFTDAPLMGRDRFVSGIDLDNLLDGGFYNGDSLINSPEGSANWFHIQVYEHSNNQEYVLQRATNLANDPKTYERNRSAGVWGEWVVAGGGGATGGGGDQVFIENGQHVTTSYTITAGKNAMSAGDIIVDDGAIVTVPDGARWVVV